MSWSYIVVVAGVILGVAMGAVLANILYRSKTRRGSVGDSATRVGVEEPSMTKSQLAPEELKALADDVAAALAGGEGVLVAGPRLAAAFGEPTPATVCRALLQPPEAGEGDVARLLGEVPATLKDLADDEVRTDLLRTVSEMFPPEVVRAEIDRQFRRRRSDGRLPAWLRTLQRLPFGAIVSLNWSDQLDKRFTADSSAVVTWGTSDDARAALEPEGLRVFKPLGDLETPASLRLWFSRRVSGMDAEALRALTYALSGKSLLFVAMTAEEIISFMDETTPSRGTAACHALIPAQSRPDEQASALLRLRYGIRVVPVGEEAMTALLDSVLQRTNQGARPTGPSDEALVLKRVRLVNIGAFTDLSIDIHQSWTVLLGDNGSGKSTVLKAIALCLAGQSYAPASPGSLLNVAAKDGMIEVTIGATTFTTRLVRDRGLVRVEPGGLTPVEAGKLLAIGLPPLRGVVAQLISGPKLESGYPGGDPVDVVPLVVGALDSRFDDIRQWLVNVAVRAEGKGNESQVARSQMDTMFNVFRRLNPGLDINYAGLDRENWDVLVGVGGRDTIPVRLLSQGSLATLSWVGLLVKRLADTFGPQILSRPTAGTGLVVIDEIDAHLHPEWQRNIIPALAEFFPSVQFVASTHSPLIVGALTRGSVLTITRDPDGPAEVTDSGDFTGWRADQILTSDAFGLESTRDVVSEDKLAAYEKSLSEKSPDEPASVAASRRRMEEELKAQLPPTGATPAARAAAEIVDEVLDSHLNSVSPKRAQELSDQLSSYLRRVRGEED